MGAQAGPVRVRQGALPGQVNEFRGNDPAQWRIEIPTYARVHAAAVNPGVALVVYRSQPVPEYDFVVAPVDWFAVVCLRVGSLPAGEGGHPDLLHLRTRVPPPAVEPRALPDVRDVLAPPWPGAPAAAVAALSGPPDSAYGELEFVTVSVFVPPADSGAKVLVR